MAVPSVYGLPAPLSVLYNKIAMWTVYLLQHAVTKERYIGRTDNLEQRLRDHNSGHQDATRRLSGQWKLIYCEQYLDKRDAVKREHRLKHHGSAKHELYKRLQFSLETESGAG